jgi:hypothetical protein
MSNGSGAWIADAASQAIPSAVTFVLGYAAARWRRVYRWARREDPLQVFVETDPEIIYANARDWILFPQFVPLDTGEQVPPPPQRTLALAQWAKEQGGTPAAWVDMQITLRAWDDLEVIVDTVRVEAIERQVPSGVVVKKPIGGASIQRAQLDVTLSTLGCTVIPRREGDGEPLDGFAFQLKPGEVQRLVLHVGTDHDAPEPVDAYGWTALLDLLVQGRRKTVKITDDGKPFVLVNANRFPTLLWMGDTWEYPS